MIKIEEKKKKKKKTEQIKKEYLKGKKPIRLRRIMGEKCRADREKE